MKIKNTNCSWKPNILQGPSLLLHTNSNPWKGGRGVAWDQLFPQINRLPFSLGILYLPLSTGPTVQGEAIKGMSNDKMLKIEF